MLFCEICRKEQRLFQEGKQGAKLCPECGGVLTEWHETDGGLRPGTVVSGFQVLHELGRGAMGIVYLARQVNLNRLVALKILSADLAGDGSYVEGFFREARSAAALSHPNIVQAYDAGVDHEVCFFVMELIDGPNLDQVVTASGALDIRFALEVARKIASAMAYAWNRQRMIHSDIKPENIILTQSGEAKLADLGLARDFRTMRGDGEIRATPAYAPPEIIRGQFDRISFRSDLYSFGATLYQLFSGRPPFQGDDPETVCAAQLNEQPRPLIALRPEVPLRLSMLIDTLMEKDPDKRPDSWEEVETLLTEIGQEESARLSGRPFVGSAAGSASGSAPDGKPAESPPGGARGVSDSHSDSRSARLLLRRLKLLCVLLAVTGSLVLVILLVMNLMEKAGPARNPEQGSDFSAPAPETAALAAWSAVSARLAVLPAPEALAEVQAFLQQFGSGAVPEAAACAEDLTRQIAAAEARQEMLRKQTDEALARQAAARQAVGNLRKMDEAAVSGQLKKLDADLLWLEKAQAQLPPPIGAEVLNTLIDCRDQMAVRAHELASLSAALHPGGKPDLAGPGLEHAEAETGDAGEPRRDNRAGAELEELRHGVKKIQTWEAAERECELVASWQREYGAKATAAELEQADRLMTYLTDAFTPLAVFLQEHQEVLRGSALFFPVDFPNYQFFGADEVNLKFNVMQGRIRTLKLVPWKMLPEAEHRRIFQQVLLFLPNLKAFDERSRLRLFRMAPRYRVEPEKLLRLYRDNELTDPVTLERLQQELTLFRGEAFRTAAGPGPKREK